MTCSSTCGVQISWDHSLVIRMQLLQGQVRWTILAYGRLLERSGEAKRANFAETYSELYTTDPLNVFVRELYTHCKQWRC